MDSKSIQCLYCHKTFASKGSLNFHRYRFHPEQSKRIQLQDEFKCVAENCDWRTSNKRLYAQHIQRKHPELKKENSNEEDYLYPCSLCGARFLNLDGLREHYANVEKKETGQKTFSNLSEYNSWLDKLKFEKHVNYVQERKWRPKRGDYVIQYNKCQHSGNVVRKGELSPSKAPGQRISIKLNLICSAFLKRSIISKKMCEHTYNNQKDVAQINAEYQWLERSQGRTTLRQIDALLRECCFKLPIATKIPLSSSYPSCLTGQQPEKLILASRNNDSIRCNVTLLGENIVQTDVAIRYAKAPGGIYRSVAQPDIPWKLHQLQDATNHCARAATVVRSGLLDNHPTNDVSNGRKLISTMAQLVEHLKAARLSLMVPRKRSLLELQEFRPNRCFNPPLPSDLLLSYYISSSMIVCAVYQMQIVSSSAGSNRQTITVCQGECPLLYLVEVLQALDSALQIVEQFSKKLALFHDEYESKLLFYSDKNPS